ncbi:MAG: site-2 protease family protein [Planctomycetes bacterium]|nr:site-2 protease family protein [Planctomycetota bacterium]
MDTFTLIGSVMIAILAITTHEAAHAWVADRLGDSTARLRGRVTLNPVPHIDPIMTIGLPALLLAMGSPFIFGGARPVPVDMRYFKNPKRDFALVAIAGPLSNLIQAMLWAGLLSILLHTEVWPDPESRGVQVLVMGIFINVLLAIFNLIPLPPLDGSRIVMYFLRGEALRSYVQLERFGLFLILALVFYVDGFGVAMRSVIMEVVGFIEQLAMLS